MVIRVGLNCYLMFDKVGKVFLIIVDFVFKIVNKLLNVKFKKIKEFGVFKVKYYSSI